MGTTAAQARTARRGGRRRLDPTLAVFGLILAAFWGAATLVIGVDALDHYPWGVRAPLPERGNAEDTIFLVNRIARDPDIDTLLVGDSTTAYLTPADIARGYPGSGRVANLSYSGTRPGDRAIMLSRLAADSTARRVVLMASWFMTLPADEMRADFPTYLYDADPLNDLRQVSPRAAPLTLKAILGRPIVDGPRAYAAFERANADQYAKFQTAPRMTRLDKTLTRAQAAYGRATDKTCDGLTTVSRDLEAFVGAMTARGATVDIVMPVYSWAYYGERTGSPLARARYGDSFLSDQLLLRRCLVQRFDGRPGVRLFAFDTAPPMGDMANYRDASHLLRKDIYAGVLQSLAADKGRLHRGNIDAYLADLQARVTGYRVYNSSIEGFDRAHP
jgi:hypothetical protein